MGGLIALLLFVGLSGLLALQKFCSRAVWSSGKGQTSEANEPIPRVLTAGAYPTGGDRSGGILTMALYPNRSDEIDLEAHDPNPDALCVFLCKPMS
jgi:hypothetical protein